MNKKRYFTSIIATFITIFVTDFIIHGKLLTELYVQTADLWRPESEMQKYFPFMTLAQAALAFIVTHLFVQNYENKGTGEGIRFGIILGALWGVMMSASYAWMPIPGELAIAWLVSGFLQGLIVGIVLSFSYKN